MLNLKKSLIHNILNIPGWKSSKKIVVLESDDWGSIRMPTKEVYEKFINKGYAVAESDYNRLDSLESNNDLEMLFDVLSRHKDSMGNAAKLTANIVVGNPDFARIKESDFSKYFFEPVVETFRRYPAREKVPDFWMEGAKNNIFHPQFHGREHVNISRWMEALREKSPDIMFTFENETTFSGKGDYNFMEVLDYNRPEELEIMKKSLKEGLDIFENIFGFRSKSFIPPCYTWNSEIEHALYDSGIKYIQGLIVQLVSMGAQKMNKRKYHFLGSQNKLGQYFLVRNAFFEPALSKSSDIVGECLKRIEIAFKWRKPAIICSHRINYIGSLVEKNRTDNLKLLNELLARIIKNWPDVEFMSSDQLGSIIEGGNL